MKQFRKRFLAVLLSFVMVFLSMSDVFSAYAAPPGVVDDPDILSSITYDDVATAARGNTDFYVGEEVPFYAKIRISSPSRSLPGAYSKLYLPKKVFGNYISSSNISTWLNRPATDYLSIDNTGDNEYIVVTMKYNTLGGGVTQTVPFKATIQPNSLANNETYTIPWQVYSADGTLLESNNNTFTAKTYPIGYTSETSNYSNTFSFLQGSSDLQNNTTLSNDNVSRIYIYTNRTDWPAAGTFHGTSTKNIGSDRRKTRLTVQLPANERFDTTDPNNAGWTYNAANHTITKDKQYGNIYTEYDNFYIKYNNQAVGTTYPYVTVSFPVSWQYVNDDGSLDAASLEKSVVTARYSSYPGTPPTDGNIYFRKSTNSPYTILLGDQDTTIHSYTMSAYWYWSSGTPSQYPVQGAYHHTIDSIEDTPEVDMDLISYKIKYPNTTGYIQGTTGSTSYQSIPVLDATQQAALSHNKLIGTKADGSTEIIATNVSITPNSTEVTLPAPKHYKKIELKFDNPIEVQAVGSNAIEIVYKFRLEQGAYNNVKNQLAPMPNNANSSVTTYNKATLKADTGKASAVTPSARDWARWTKAFAYEYQHYTQNNNLGTRYINDIVSVSDNIQFYYNLGAGGRDIKNPKYYVLADPGFEFQELTASSYYSPQLTQAVLNNYRVEYNFKNTGKTAYIWDFPDLNLPQGNSAYYYLQLYPKFKFTRNVTAGPGTIDTYLSWDNNEEAPVSSQIPGLYADTLDLDNDGNTTEKFSSKQEKYVYTPPLELILTKRSKRADAGNTQYSSITTPDSEQIVDYQLNIFNNSVDPVSGYTFFDILPHVGDKAVAPDQQGNYADRGSTYKVTLAGPINANSNYTYEYSTTPVTEGNIAANYAGATWVTSVSDWSQVTMFRAKMKPGHVLSSHSTDIITFKANMPSTVPLDTTDKAVNTFAGFSGDNYTGAFEALANTVTPKKYKISGKIYYDVPPTGGTANGTYLTTDDDAPAAGRSVALYKSDGTPVLDASGNPVTTTADANGDYAFDNISTQGTYKVVVTPGTGDTLSGIHVTSTSLVIGNDFNNATLGGNAVFEANVTVTPSADKKTANAALEASNSTLKVKYVDMSGNPIPLDDGSGNVPDTDSTHTFRAAYNVTPPTALTGVTNFEYAEPDLTNGRPLTGTLNPGQNVVILKYKRKQAGDITVHHYEVGQTTELYKPAGATTPSAEVFDGTAKLGLTENLTNKAADIDNFEYVSVDRTGAGSATSPSATGATTVTYLSTPQTVTYYYKRKNAANITVHHYEDGTTTELYSQTAGGTPSAVTISGTGKLGLTEDLTNKAADIDNYDYVGIDVSGAPSATSPSSTGETTLTHRTTAQTVIYKYKRKDAGNVIVHHYEQGTTTQLVPDMTLPGAGKLGLPYTTTTQNIPNFTVVSATPTGHTGNYPAAGSDITVTYEYKRKNAGNITVNHYIDGTTTQLYKHGGSTTPSAEVFNGTGKLGLSEDLTNKEADIDNYEFVRVDVTGASGANTPNTTTGATTVTYVAGNQVVNYYYRRKDAANITVHHYEDGTTTELYSPTGGTPSAVVVSGSGKLGVTESFTNKEANIANFEYVGVDTSGAPSATTPSATGTTNLTHGTSSQTLIYKYRRKNAGNVLVHHYEQGTTTSVSADENLSGVGKMGLTYNTSPATVTNYTVVNATPADHTGTYPNTGTTVVTYYYTRNNAGDVTVHHYEQGTTTSVAADENLSGTGKLGLPYTTNDQSIPHFTLVAQPTNKNGTFTAGAQTVIYEYRRNDAGNVLVHHYEAGSTTQVSPDENLSGVGKSGLTYTTSPAAVANYTVVNATPTDHSGNYPASGTTVVTYYYTRNDAGDVTVKYLEQGTGTSLHSDVLLSGVGKLGLPYTTNEENITDYELVAQPANKNGTFTAGSQTVIYEYRRKPAGDVTTVYVDDEGNVISTPDVQSGVGKLGLPYTTTARTIPNFTLVSTPVNANGVFTSGPQTVTYVYRRSDAGNVTVYHKSVYDNSDLSSPTVLDGTRKLGLPYTTSPESYADFEVSSVPANANGTFASGAQTVTYLYKRKQSGGVRVNYLDNHGNSIETPDNITGSDNVGLPYTTSPKTIPYYDLITVPTNANGVFSVAPITVDYIYKRQDAGNVVIEHLDENGNVPLETPEVLDGTEKLGMPYTSSVKSFDNFDVISVPTNSNGTFVSGSQTVTYVYRRKDAGNVIARYLNTAGLPIESDEILDGTRSLGLPYATTEKAIAGYSLYLIQGANTGIFTTGEIVVTYIYRKDPSAVIIPGPLTPVTPVNPSVINPVTPSVINPSIPVNPSNINPSTPVNPNPSRIATPSQINIPGRDQDIIIRPTATPSIATPSNIKRGGSSGGSSGGNSVVRPGKTVTVNDINSKGGVTTPETVIDKPVINTDKTDTNKIGFDKNQRKALAVPKTADERDVRGYMFILMSSFAAAMVLALKKKEER